MASMTVGWFTLGKITQWLFQSLFIVKIVLLSFEYPGRHINGMYHVFPLKLVLSLPWMTGCIFNMHYITQMSFSGTGPAYNHNWGYLSMPTATGPTKKYGLDK